MATLRSGHGTPARPRAAFDIVAELQAMIDAPAAVLEGGSAQRHPPGRVGSRHWTDPIGQSRGIPCGRGR